MSEKTYIVTMDANEPEPAVCLWVDKDEHVEFDTDAEEWLESDGSPGSLISVDRLHEHLGEEDVAKVLEKLTPGSKIRIKVRSEVDILE